MNRQSAGNRDKEIIVKYNENKSILETAKFFNVSYETIRKVIRENGFVSNKKKPVFSNTLKMDYFHNIDTQDKAYFYGFIKADGYVDVKRNRLAIRIQDTDIEILKMFCDAVNLPITRINVIERSKTSQYHSSNRKDCVEIAITNETFVKPLLDIKKESSLLNVPDHLKYHFIRGYFDGDGCIAYANKSKLRYQLNIQGSPSDDSMLKYICKYFNFNIFLDKRSDLPVISSSNLQTLLDFQEKVYSNCFVYLARKKSKFDNLRFLYELSSTTTRETSQRDEDIV